MQDLHPIVLALAQDISTPRSLTVSLLMEYGEWEQLVRLRCYPEHYLDADSFFVDNQITELLRKCAGLDTGFDTRMVAEDGFLEAERQCKLTNLRLQSYVDQYWPDDDYSPFLDRKVREIQKYIRYVLGPAPTIEDLDGRFGPGSAYETSSGHSLVADKVSGIPTITPSLIKALPTWAKNAWGRNVLRQGGQIRMTEGNRFTTVPKDAMKDRGICVEPSINGFYQLAIGRQIRRRLLRSVGIDLDFAQTKHRELARKGSIHGDLATLDLSNASDTVSYNLVKLLIPTDWFELLDATRSPTTLFKGSIYHLEKFSSMGNGYTFELETLLFHAIAQVIVREKQKGGFAHVFGDDIIVPTTCAEEVVAAMSIFGLFTNARKSFIKGQFKESCGGDYFNGVAVRPHYIKEIPHEPHQYIALANGLRRAGCQDNDLDNLDPRFIRAWFRVLARIPSKCKCYGPPDLGDIVIHAPKSWWKVRTKDSVHQLLTWSPTKRRGFPLERWDDDSVVCALLYGARADYKKVGTRIQGYYYPRNCVESYSNKWVPRS